MKISNVFLLAFLVILNLNNANTQSFHTKVIGGLNASQLEGDNLSGFNKVGLHTGIGVSYQLPKNALSIELLFNQKGSSAKANANNGTLRQSTTLNYLQIPIMYQIRSWYNDDDNFYQINIEAGPYVARLFEASSNNLDIDNLIDQFNKTDAGIVVGANYRFSRQWSIGLRYDQSFVKILDNPLGSNDGLLSFLATLKVGYHL